MTPTRNRTRRRLERLDDTDLGQLVQAGGDDAQAARDVLVERHRGLVVHLARRWAQDDDDIDDLVQEGMLGLCRAIEKWDPARGVPIGPWARQRIVQRMNRGAPSLPRHQIYRPEMWWSERLAVKRCEQDLGQTLGRAVTPKDIADQLGWRIDVVEDRLGPVEPTAIDTLVQPPAANDVDAETVAVRHGETAEMMVLLARLPEPERTALTSLALGHTRHETSRQMGITYEAVTRLQQRAVAMMLHPRYQPVSAVEHQVAA